MGGCLTRLKAETAAPPPRGGNWADLSPQRPLAYLYKPKTKQANLDMENERKGSDTRDYGDTLNVDEKLRQHSETRSKIPGLTFDQAGRPVWRGDHLSPVAQGMDLETLKVEM